MNKLIAELFCFSMISLLYLKKGKGKQYIFFVFFITIITSSAIFSLLIREIPLLPITSSSTVILASSLELKHAINNKNTDVILLIDGGSYPSRGLYGKQLAKKLSEDTGLSYESVQVTMPGANHFERRYILKNLIKLLNHEEVKNMRRKEVHLLLEVQLGYDENPLSQFYENKYTHRCYAYLTPEIMLDALPIVFKKKENGDSNYLGKINDSVDVIAHIIVNAMAIGAINRVGIVHKQRIIESGFQPLYKHADNFTFDGLDAVLNECKKESTKIYDYSWNDDTREPRLLNICKGLIDKVVYYSVPNCHKSYLSYAKSFCLNHPDKLCIHYGNEILLTSLNNKNAWHDTSHLKKEGADIFTNWFSDQYVLEVK